MTPLRVAIVNDLAVARLVLRRVVESVPGYRVAWEAADGAEAVAWAAADRPDAVLMDLVMPVMDGAEATRRIMTASPCPVLVVTASVGANHGKVYEALGAGGLDAVTTPTLGPGGTLRGAAPLLARLAALTRTVAVPSLPLTTVAPSLAPGGPVPRGVPMLAVGASTGGPEAVAQVLAGLGGPAPGPVVVVQHIGPDFTLGLAEWLASRTGMAVRVPTAGERPAPGVVYVGGGDNHLVVDPAGRFGYTPHPTDYPYRPSVDVFFNSAGTGWPAGGVAVLLTGMGADGARGLLGLRGRGWHAIAQGRRHLGRVRHAQGGRRTGRRGRGAAPRPDRPRRPWPARPPPSPTRVTARVPGTRLAGSSQREPRGRGSARLLLRDVPPERL